MKGVTCLDIKEEIYKTVETIVQRYVEDQNQSEQVSGIVLDTKNGKYTVSVNGSKYLVKDGVGINPSPNTPVWICVPNNDWNQAYICAGKANINSGVGDVKDVFQNNVSVLGEDKIARIRCATPEDIQQLQVNFQAGVDAIGNACERKGSPPASSSLEDTVAAIDAIQTGGNYMTKEIREDGVYYAEDDGVDAYDVVVVSKDVGQPHTVVFYDPDGDVIKTQINVPYHGYATCTLLDGTFYQGLYFKGWNPAPTNVRTDLECYPQYGDYVITPGQIEDDWPAICANGGANYPLGAFHSLVFSVPAETYTFDMTSSNGNVKTFTDNMYGYNVVVDMIKVAEGEDGSTSSWMSTGGIYFRSTSSVQGYMCNMNNPLLPADGEWAATQVDWGNAKFPDYLDTNFLSRMPQCLQDTIVAVNKYYTGYASYTQGATTKVEKSRINKIWVPSVKELQTYFSGKSANVYPYQNSGGWGYIDSVQEEHGIDYSSVYVPTYVQGSSDNELGFRTCMPTSSNRRPWEWYPSYVSILAETQDTYYRATNRITYFPFGFCLGSNG